MRIVKTITGFLAGFIVALLMPLLLAWYSYAKDTWFWDADT